MEQLFMQDVAEMAGISVETVRSHRKLGDLARAEFRATESDFPMVHDYDGIRPWWTKEQIDGWLAARRKPGKPSGVTRQAMRDVLAAAMSGNIDRTIQLAKDALK